MEQMAENIKNSDAGPVSEGLEAYRKGNACVLENKAGEAREYFQEALEKGYVNFKSLLAAAMVEKTRGDKEETLRLLERMCKMYPEVSVPHKLYLEELYEQKRYEDGWKYLLEKDEIFDRESRAYLELKARFASALQMEKPAREAFLLLYEKYDSREAALALAIFALVRQETEEAKKYMGI